MFQSTLLYDARHPKEMNLLHQRATSFETKELRLVPRGVKPELYKCAIRLVVQTHFNISEPEGEE